MKFLKAMGLSKPSIADEFLQTIQNLKINSNTRYEDIIKDWTCRCNELGRTDRYEFCLLVIRERIEQQSKRNEASNNTRFDITDWHKQSIKYDLLAKSISKIKPTPNECHELMSGLSKVQSDSRLITAYRTLIRFVVKQWEHYQHHPKLAVEIPKIARELKSSSDKDWRKLAAHITEGIDGQGFVPVEAGEAWSDAVLEELRSADDMFIAVLQGILLHSSTATGSKPTKKWLSRSCELIEEISPAQFSMLLTAWFPLVSRPRTAPNTQQDWRGHALGDLLIVDQNADVLKGLCWMAGNNEDEEVARALGALALTCYKKIPGVGPRAVKIGNAAVYALGAMPGRAAIGQLAILRIKLKFASAQKLIIKALDTVAQREGIPRDQIEEMAIPGYGLESVGFCEQELGEYAARVSVSSAGNASPCKLVWMNRKGKEIKSVPAAIKRDFPDELKELKASVKDINKMLPVQRDRIDGLFLERKSWPMNLWRERYLDHPLIGTIARRMIWVFTHGKEHTAAAWLPDKEQLVQVNGDEFIPDDDATVSLWHPIREDAEDGQNPLRIDVLDWRKFYEERGIVQPFKQAHREIYLLTDAERNTDIYSNRFAAHILRQHQFNALCIGRFWKNQLRIMADMECHPPRRDLSAWGLRSEFWVEGVGDDYNEELVSESGAFLYLATDQVRFYAIESAQNIGHVWGGQYQNEGEADDENHPISLQHIPPIVLSEILRDVDLFVGVSSVGNNPEWADGGPEGQFRDYWHTYSFGALSGTAQTRRELLERLVPRLKIASQCEVGAKFLTVRGNVRTYKIHLGSGNILMEPNDQYLCIVPTSAMSKGPNGQKVHLPFEGDRVLAIILSKAFLLADDHKVKDKTILTQIHHK